MTNAAAAVEKFLAENPVDERAASALRNATPEVQLQAMERGSLSDCKNPSAALMVRINGSAGHSSHNSGLNQRDMQGTPEEVWAKIMAKNKSGQTLSSDRPMPRPAFKAGAWPGHWPPWPGDSSSGAILILPKMPKNDAHGLYTIIFTLHYRA
ncbi:unnamed protein product [Durusdinium trenchii]|uniref:Uncharacterized protein n=1 Tax=Durusdinium trenchii TaxID=1381693 RepID=A0ABP0PW52_9DINO